MKYTYQELMDLSGNYYVYFHRSFEGDDLCKGITMGLPLAAWQDLPDNHLTEIIKVFEIPESLDEIHEPK